MNIWSYSDKFRLDGFCRSLTDLHLKLHSASDYNAVYNYIIKKQVCQGLFGKKFKIFCLF